MHISQFDYLPPAPGFFSILVALFIVGLPPPYAPMDFAAWIEVYPSGVPPIPRPRHRQDRKGLKLSKTCEPGASHCGGFFWFGAGQAVEGALLVLLASAQDFPTTR
jgi:hypothetical protein